MPHTHTRNRPYSPNSTAAWPSARTTPPYPHHTPTLTHETHHRPPHRAAMRHGPTPPTPAQPPLAGAAAAGQWCVAPLGPAPAAPACCCQRQTASRRGRGQRRRCRCRWLPPPAANAQLGGRARPQAGHRECGTGLQRRHVGAAASRQAACMSRRQARHCGGASLLSAPRPKANHTKLTTQSLSHKKVRQPGGCPDGP